MPSAERKARPPPPLDPLATTARHRSRPSSSSSVGQRDTPPTSFITDAADPLGLRRFGPLPPPAGSYAARRCPPDLPPSSSVKRRKDSSSPPISTTADDAMLLDGGHRFPPLPGFFGVRRPPPLPASSVERHQEPPRPPSLSATEGPLHRHGQTRRSQDPPPKDPPPPLCFSTTHSHRTKALPTPTAGSPVLTRDPAITSSTNPFVVPIPRSHNNLSKQEFEKRQKQQRNLAEVAIVYRSIVLLIFSAVVFYYEYRRLVVLVSEIAAVSCVFLYLWSSHIIQFWLDRPVTQDLSAVVFIWCLVFCMLAFLVGVTTSPVAGMLITCLAATCMATFFVSSLREYLHSPLRRGVSKTRPGCCISEGGGGFSDAVHERAYIRRMRMFHQKASVEVGVSKPIKPAWK